MRPTLIREHLLRVTRRGKAPNRDVRLGIWTTSNTGDFVQRGERRKLAAPAIKPSPEIAGSGSYKVHSGSTRLTAADCRTMPGVSGKVLTAAVQDSDLKELAAAQESRKAPETQGGPRLTSMRRHWASSVIWRRKWQPIPPRPHGPQALSCRLQVTSSRTGNRRTPWKS